MKLVTLLGLMLFLGGAQVCAAADAPKPTPAQRILDSRSAITVEGGQLAGTGAGVLHDATQHADYVLLGEDHGTAEIPRFADALFTSLVPSGFQTAVVETGPELSTQLQKWIAQPAGVKQFVAFESRFPATTAFFSWRDEYAFLRHAYTVTGGKLQVWGIDQELMGASGFLLTSIQAENPGPRSRALLAALLQENVKADAAAYKSGDPSATLMMTVSRDKLTALRASLQTDGTPAALRFADALLASRDIYVNCCNALATQSNRDRAHLMKRNLATYLAAPGATRKKLFFKFGEEHLYRGFNVVRNNDIGNYVAEIADAAGKSDVHILALGTGGEQIKFAGMGHWTHATYSISDDEHVRFKYLMPFVDAALPTGWTLFDLRPFRTRFNAMQIADKDFERLVWGYDFLLLIPNTTSDDPLDPSVF
jgi:hypothetical protein